jgi:hypothetical protein
MSLHHPDHLTGAHAGENRLDGTIVEAVYLGTHTQYVVRFADGQTSTVHLQNNTVQDRDFRPGDPAAILFPIESATLLAD